MKTLVCILIFFCALMVGVVSAQENWTEGPAWECGGYRTKDGEFDNYIKYLREHYLPINEEAKKQGLILDSKIFLQSPTNPNEWDVLICTLQPSFGKLLDYNAADEEKFKAIAAKHYATTDEAKQREMTAKRFAMRTYIGTTLAREITLRPLK